MNYKVAFWLKYDTCPISKFCVTLQSKKLFQYKSIQTSGTLPQPKINVRQPFLTLKFDTKHEVF